MGSSNGNGSRPHPDEPVSRAAQAPILIVDDTRDNLMLFHSMLKSLGQPIVTASSGREALAACADTDFAAILLDVQMPEMDGFEVAAKMRESERTHSTPILFVTALHTDQAKVRRGYALGAVDYLFKPVVLEILRAKVAAFIELYLQRDELRSALKRAQAAEQKLMDQAAELKRSNEELEQFAYVASHDLQEPLRMVRSYLQLIEKRYKGQLDAQADEFISFAVDGAARMSSLVRDLLTYSRIGTRRASVEPVDMAKCIRQAQEDLKVAIAEKNASIATDPMPVIEADPGQMTQLFQNLIGNGIKFCASAVPRINISARRGFGEWTFSVADNGIGIEPQYLDRIFVIFQRLHTRDEYPGTGIGLAICKKIVEGRGGRIWVESEPGRGTTFLFSIPDQHDGRFSETIASPSETR
jgi:signal transduction histidine kinase